MPPPAARGVFVTGTGTGVGKTVVAALIARTLRQGGASVGVFKPALSGLDDHSADGGADHELLRLAAGSGQSDDEIAPYRYGPAVSPHLAAELTGEAIDRARLLAVAKAAAAGRDALVCEGVGGFLVPLRADYLVRDLARDLGYPVVIAAAPGLGTISHTLLTIEAVRAAGLDPVLVALTPWPADPSALERSNRETIAALGNLATATVGHLDLADPASWPRIDIGLA